MNGLNLEFRGLQRATEFKRYRIGSEDYRSATNQRLDELIEQKTNISEKQHRSTKQDQRFYQMASFSHAPNTRQEEILRELTNLRQRKISTQLKIDALSKQLGGNPNKPNPRTVTQEAPEDKSYVENQLKELKTTLQEIENSLESVRKQAEQTLRKLSISYDDLIHPGLDKRYPLDSTTLKQTSFLEYISKSEEDCRRVLMKSKSAKFFGSLKSKKYFEKDDQMNEERTSCPSLSRSYTTDIPVSLQSGKASRNRRIESLMTSVKTRRSPLRLFGNFVDSQIRGRLGSQRRHKSAERLLTETHEKNEKFSLRSSTTEDINTVDALKRESSGFQERTLKKQELVETSNGDSKHSRHDSGPLKVPSSKTEKNKVKNVDKEENRDEESLQIVRTKIDPGALAEIEVRLLRR
ncbi:uncharacterized protein LOC106473681 isoform X2 [Limulus polyphemus]|uniref:Uncharacterized protein LOC106473681 isoform X2 n=1 Tax=Limulus polyphemus TaxID=6850 RepID=A0ABM1TPI5_LIMPO|nr:uncharacterized protein LOC106473681 isoform X2 [Limulus polyphemus]